MSDSIKGVVHKRVHLERHQPSDRKRLGYLEKHSDYSKRAKDYNRKQDAIKRLQRKAAFRNKEEFSFKMLSKKMKGGRLAKKAEHLSTEELRLLETTDARYVGIREQMDKKAAARQAEKLHFLEADRPNKHTLFIDDDDLESERFTSTSSSSTGEGKRNRRLEEIDVAKYFDTHPTMLPKKANRMTTRQLETTHLCRPEIAQRKMKSAYKELFSHQERAKKLTRTREALELRASLRQGGRMRKTKEGTKDSPAQYKWMYERKK